MVDAEQDVLDAEAQVGHGERRGSGRRYREAGTARLEQLGDRVAAGELDADEDVGERRVEPGDGERLAPEAALADDRGAVEERTFDRFADALPLDTA